MTFSGEQGKVHRGHVFDQGLKTCVCLNHTIWHMKVQWVVWLKEYRWWPRCYIISRIPSFSNKVWSRLIKASYVVCIRCAFSVG